MPSWSGRTVFHRLPRLRWILIGAPSTQPGSSENMKPIARSARFLAFSLRVKVRSWTTGPGEGEPLGLGEGLALDVGLGDAEGEPEGEADGEADADGDELGEALDPSVTILPEPGFTGLLLEASS